MRDCRGVPDAGGRAVQGVLGKLTMAITPEEEQHFRELDTLPRRVAELEKRLAALEQRLDRIERRLNDASPSR